MKNRFYRTTLVLVACLLSAEIARAQGLIGDPACPGYCRPPCEPSPNYMDDNISPIISILILVALTFIPLPVRNRSRWMRSGIDLVAAIIVPIAVKIAVLQLTMAVAPLNYGL
ncbi:MAG: hypothetical protein U0103_14300 [Candidatus Obscuribacterales bacterium]